MYAYVTLKDHVTEPEEQVIQELRDIVRKKIAGYAVPEMIQVSITLYWSSWILISIFQWRIIVCLRFRKVSVNYLVERRILYLKK